MYMRYTPERKKHWALIIVPSRSPILFLAMVKYEAAVSSSFWQLSRESGVECNDSSVDKWRVL
jgi:hypothetical protein